MTVPMVDVGDFVASSDISGWDVVFAAIALVATWIVARIARRAAERLLGQVEGLDAELRQLIARIAKYLVWATGGGVALSFLGAQVQPLLTVALVVAVIGGLALRGVAESFAAGLVIQTRHPFGLGDRVELLDHEGIVVEINGRSVVIETPDGRTVHLPNAKVLDAPIINLSVRGARSTEIEVRTAVSHEVDAVIATISAAVVPFAGPEGLAASVTVAATEPTRYVLRAKIWHEPGGAGPATSNAIRAINTALRESGVEATVVAPPPPGASPSAPSL